MSEVSEGAADEGEHPLEQADGWGASGAKGRLAWACSGLGTESLLMVR